LGLIARWMPRSLIGRVFALYSVTLLAFVAAGLGLFYRYQFSVELEAEQTRAEALALVILPTVSDSAVIGDDDTIARTLERTIFHSRFTSAAFIDLKGRQVRAQRKDAPELKPPAWLTRLVDDRLYDTNLPINVGGRDYGVLRLSLAPELIAGDLWRPVRAALLLGALSLVGGLVLIRLPLVHWLGHLGRLRTLEEGLRSGEAGRRDAMDADAPIEFRQTFEVLNQAAENLQAQREQAAVTLAAIGDAVLTLDVAGAVVLANPAAGTLFGRPVQALLRLPVRSLLPGAFNASSGGTAPGSGDAVLAPWRDRHVGLHGPGGGLMMLETTLSTILGPAGAAVGHVLACRDITAQHQLDQRLRNETSNRESALSTLRGVLEGLSTDSRAMPAGEVEPAPAAPAGLPQVSDIEAISLLISGLVARLQERGEQLDAIFGLSPDGFVSFDAARRVSFVNAAFERLTGLGQADVLGLGEEAFGQRLAALCQATAAEQMPGLAALRRDRQASVDGEPEARRALIETERPTRRVLQVGLRQSQSPVISQVFHVRDVTHETEVDQMKSEFLSTAAHELRTPMASIYGFCELLLHRQMAPERQREMLQVVYRQTQRMVTILNELLDLARIEARRGTDFQLESVDLAQLAQDVVAEFQPPTGRDRPHMPPLPAGLLARLDRNKMHQALGNVLSNAYKYSPGGGPVSLSLVAGELATAVGDDPPAQVVTWGIRVQDSGIGMTAEQLARVSERFYRADASGNIPGTGLGMSIVKEIVELLGGRLQITSQPDQGSAVTLWLPVAAGRATVARSQWSALA
jgi:signal transduction histidine kinase